MPGGISDTLAALEGMAGLHPGMDQKHPSRKHIKPLQEKLAEPHPLYTNNHKHLYTPVNVSKKSEYIAGSRPRMQAHTCSLCAQHAQRRLLRRHSNLSCAESRPLWTSREERE